MERLTEKVFGFVQLKACGNDFCKETCAEHDEEKSCKNCPIQKAFEKLAEYEDFEEIFREKMTDTACEFLSDKEEFKKWLDRNKWIAKKCDEYARAEEQGLLLRLPCKVGDDIYVIPSEVNYRLNKSFGAKGLNLVCMQVVDHIEFNSYGYLVSTNEGMTVHRQEAFGETWFLTREEAEQKLKEMERG